MCCHSCLELGLRLATRRVGSTAPPRKAHSAADWIHVRHRLDSTEGSSSLPAPTAQVKKEASSKEEGKRPRKKKYASIFYKPVPEEKELAELLDKRSQWVAQSSSLSLKKRKIKTRLVSLEFKLQAAHAKPQETRSAICAARL